MDEADELLDVFDMNEKLIGTIKRSDTKTLKPGHDRYIRAANAFIQRSNGDIWVPTRGLHKDLAPGGLDYSVGGHVLKGESYEGCLVREAQEEARLHVTASDLELVLVSPPDETRPIYFTRLYLIRTDMVPRLSNEHVSGEWMSVQTLIKRLEMGAFAKKCLLPDSRYLVVYLSNRHHE